MDFLDDPAEMTPEQRLAELAAILAAGWLRLRATRPFTEKRLDTSDRSTPLCGNWLTDGEPARTEDAA